VSPKPSRARPAAPGKRARAATGAPVEAAQSELALRITLVVPPAGVTFCLQRGKDELVSPVRSTGGPISFDFTVRVRPASGGGPMTFLGPFTQGPPASRFVYVNSGTMAGETGTPWTRRAKIPLAGITEAMVGRALADPASRIEARIQGTARDGGPACATCRPLGGWSRVSG
jgi:hypothetical protein